MLLVAVKVSRVRENYMTEIEVVVTPVETNGFYNDKDTRGHVVLFSCQ